jgi:dTDP-4-dehydrorhamnose reductase
MRLLITGVSGMIGSNIAAAARTRQWDVTGTWHSCPVTMKGVETMRLDITDTGSWRAVMEQVRPDVVVHNAASVDLIRLESDERLARANVAGAINAVRAAERCGGRVALVSSDWVFAGDLPPGESYDEMGTVAPLNAYGRSKAGSETAVLGASVDSLITRPANVYGVNLADPADRSDSTQHVIRRSSLALRWLTSLSRGEEVPAPADIHQSPTSASSYATQLCDLIDAGATGIYHTAGPESMHRLGYIRALAEDFDLDPGLVVERPLRDSLGPMFEDPAAVELRLPHNTALQVKKATEAVGGQVGLREGHAAMRRQMSSLGIAPAHQRLTKETVA